VWLRPAPGTTLDVVLRNAVDPDDALAKAFALGNPSDVAGVWVDGRQVRR
jgi:guanine deaminase